MCRISVDEVTEAINRLRTMGMNFQNKILGVIPVAAKSGGTNNIVAVQKAVIEGTNTQVIEKKWINEDFIFKLRTAVSLTPVAIALFANSPLEDGKLSTSLSRRTEHWFKTDSRRSRKSFD